MIEVLFWVAVGVAVVVLSVMTVQLLTHNPATCRTCVERAARRRHPAYRAVEDSDDWGGWRP
jgi:heme exporter protein D